jgi:hypothetical protein
MPPRRDGSRGSAVIVTTVCRRPHARRVGLTSGEEGLAGGSRRPRRAEPRALGPHHRRLRGRSRPELRGPAPGADRHEANARRPPQGQDPCARRGVNRRAHPPNSEPGWGEPADRARGRIRHGWGKTGRRQGPTGRSGGPTGRSGGRTGRSGGRTGRKGGPTHLEPRRKMGRRSRRRGGWGWQRRPAPGESTPSACRTSRSAGPMEKEGVNGSEGGFSRRHPTAGWGSRARRRLERSAR